MKRHHYLTLSALYLVAHASLAAEVSPPVGVAGVSRPAAQDANGDEETFDVMSAIRDEVVAADKLSSRFETLAGSHQNAQNLIAGLRNAHLVKLVDTAQAVGQDAGVSFLPPTKPMAYGDIRQALTLAQAQLASKHIASPTASQLKAVLAGGELPNSKGDLTRVIGILPLHKRGMSWDAIARVLRVDSPARIARAETVIETAQLP
jgi:hypothetical protein